MGIRPLSAPIPNLSPRFPDHTIPRLSLGESTGIERGQTSQLRARLAKTSPESRPDRKSVSPIIAAKQQVFSSKRGGLAQHTSRRKSAQSGTIKNKTILAYTLERVARRLPRESRAEGRQRSSL